MKANGYQETIEKGLNALRVFSRVSYGIGTREEQLKRLKDELASAEGIDDLILGDVVFQARRDSRESLVALYQTVKLRPRGGDDDRLTGNIMR